MSSVFWGLGREWKERGVYKSPYTIEECLQIMPPCTDEAGNVTAETVFQAPRLDLDSWWPWPNTFVGEQTFDVMGSPEEVYFSATNKTFQVPFTSDQAFLDPDEKDVMDPHQPGYGLDFPVPDKVPGFLKPALQSLLRKLRMGSAHYNVTHEEKNVYRREHGICPLGTNVVDTFAVGPAQNGRKDMSSLRFQAVFTVPPLLALLFYPIIDNFVQQAWFGSQEGTFDHFSAVYAALHPDKNKNIPRCQKVQVQSNKASRVANAIYLIGLMTVLCKLTGWLSCLLIALTGATGSLATLLSPCVIRAVLFLGFLFYLSSLFMKYRNLGICPDDWEKVTEDYLKKSGLDKDKGPGPSPGKLRVGKVTYGKDRSAKSENPLPPTCCRLLRERAYN